MPSAQEQQLVQQPLQADSCHSSSSMPPHLMRASACLVHGSSSWSSSHCKLAAGMCCSPSGCQRPSPSLPPQLCDRGTLGKHCSSWDV
eukprot:1158508-Pelagomonas_calceolata.AAC.34